MEERLAVYLRCLVFVIPTGAILRQRGVERRNLNAGVLLYVQKIPKRYKHISFESSSNMIRDSSASFFASGEFISVGMTKIGILGERLWGFIVVCILVIASWLSWLLSLRYCSEIVDSYGQIHNMLCIFLFRCLIASNFHLIFRAKEGKLTAYFLAPYYE